MHSETRPGDHRRLRRRDCGNRFPAEMEKIQGNGFRYVREASVTSRANRTPGSRSLEAAVWEGWQNFYKNLRNIRVQHEPDKRLGDKLDDNQKGLLPQQKEILETPPETEQRQATEDATSNSSDDCRERSGEQRCEPGSDHDKSSRTCPLPPHSRISML